MSRALDPLRRTLRRTFGIGNLRPGQGDVIASVLGGHDTLAIMPTGAGKSLCYQLPALHLEGTTVIVSPLISLMKDQVDKLIELGLDASQVNSTLTGREEAHAVGRISAGKTEFVFTTPERMADAEFIATLSGATIDFLVIDEAHCISEWGHDFRPAYLGLQEAIRALGDPPVLALTATATEAVTEDIRRQLGRPAMRIIDTGIYRPNLMFEVRQLTGDDAKREALLDILAETPGTGIVYAATVRAVEQVTEELRLAGHDVARFAQSSRRTPSVSASTSPTYGSSCIMIFPGRSRPTIRKRGGPGAMASRPAARCCSTTGTAGLNCSSWAAGTRGWKTCSGSGVRSTSSGRRATRHRSRTFRARPKGWRRTRRGW